MARQTGWTKETADHYYEKLGIKCATKEEYRKWFILAERCNLPCRKLKAFCADCTVAFECAQRSTGSCIKPLPLTTQE